MSGKSKSGRRKFLAKSGLIDDFLQLGTAPELRIGKPRRPKRPKAEPPQAAEPAAARPPEPPVTENTVPSPLPISLAAEIANCLWYIKTKHFRCAWRDQESPDDDPRARRTLGRINRCMQALADAGLELIDPVGKRYPPGGEGLMRPLQFTPTAGVAGDLVSETVRPIVYFQHRIVQRGEVFVAVPVETQAAPAPAADHGAIED